MPTLDSPPPARHRPAAGAAPDPGALYERDLSAWARTQAALLRSGHLAQADLEHIAEEIEDSGKSELRELENRLAVLFRHRLKWQHQPERRGRSWDLTIREQRRQLGRHLGRNPSRRPRLRQAVAEAYGDAVLAAARDTERAAETFVPLCPYTIEQIIDDRWLPGSDSTEA